MAVGVLGLLLMVFIRRLSPAFHFEILFEDTPARTFVALMMLAGGIYLLLFYLLPKIRDHRTVLAVLFLVGLFSRLAFFGSTPIYEDDWYRYLWDGAVINAGVNPYSITPAEASILDVPPNDQLAASNPDLNTVKTLGVDQEYWPEKVNYPYVTTGYPPLAQAAFAAANRIAPFNLDAWRFVLLVFDLAALFTICALLRQSGRSYSYAALYWLNPLLIVSAFNAAHMDILLVPFLVGTLLLTTMNKPRVSTLALGAAVAVKLWPIILAPIFYRSWRKNLGELVIIGICLGATLILLVGPMLIDFDTDKNGLFAYANSWQRNSFIFPLIVGSLEGILYDPDLFGRAFTFFVTASFIVWAAFMSKTEMTKQAATLLYATLIFFLVSPTGYPWYAIWIFIYLPFAPRLSAGVLVVTLPIYYLRYALEAADHGSFFDNILVPIEFLPPLCFLFIEFLRYCWARREKQSI